MVMDEKTFQSRKKWVYTAFLANIIFFFVLCYKMLDYGGHAEDHKFPFNIRNLLDLQEQMQVIKKSADEHISLLHSAQSEDEFLPIRKSMAKTIERLDEVTLGRMYHWHSTQTQRALCDEFFLFLVRAKKTEELDYFVNLDDLKMMYPKDYFKNYIDDIQSNPQIIVGIHLFVRLKPEASSWYYDQLEKITHIYLMSLKEKKYGLIQTCRGYGQNLYGVVMDAKMLEENTQKKEALERLSVLFQHFGSKRYRLSVASLEKTYTNKTFEKEFLLLLTEEKMLK